MNPFIYYDNSRSRSSEKNREEARRARLSRFSPIAGRRGTLPGQRVLIMARVILWTAGGSHDGQTVSTTQHCSKDGK